MKKLFGVALLLTGLIASTSISAQKMDEDKSKRPSPPAIANQKIESGATIKIDYSQPTIKGRTISKDLEPMEGQVWRTGSNEQLYLKQIKTWLYREKNCRQENMVCLHYLLVIRLL